MGIFAQDQTLEFPISIYHPATFEPPIDFNMSLQFALNSTRRTKANSISAKRSTKPGIFQAGTISKRIGNQYTKYQKRHAAPKNMENSQSLPWLEKDSEVSFQNKVVAVKSTCDSILYSTGNSINELSINSPKSIQNYNQTCIPNGPVPPTIYARQSRNSLSEISGLIMQEHSIQFDYSEYNEKDKSKNGLDGLWDSSIFLMHGTFADTIEHDNAHTLPELSHIHYIGSKSSRMHLKEDDRNSKIKASHQSLKSAISDKSIVRDRIPALEKSIDEIREEPSNFNPVFQKRFSYDYANSVKEKTLETSILNSSRIHKDSKFDLEYAGTDIGTEMFDNHQKSYSTYTSPNKNLLGFNGSYIAFEGNMKRVSESGLLKRPLHPNCIYLH